MKRPIRVTPFTRHRKSCQFASRGEFFPRCPCPKFLRYSINGRLRRLPAQTRTWNVAEEKAAELQNQLERGNPLIVRAEVESQTLEQTVATFISGKSSEGLGKPTLRKLRRSLIPSCCERSRKRRMTASMPARSLIACAAISFQSVTWRQPRFVSGAEPCGTGICWCGKWSR